VNIWFAIIEVSKSQFTDAEVRGETDIGMSRLALSDADKSARDWFVQTTKSLGCDVQVDAMGMHLPSSCQTEWC